MTPSRIEAVRRQARRAGKRVADRVVARAGFELVRPQAGAAPVPPGHELIPTGRTERFEAAGYDVLPKGRYDIVERNYYSPVPDLSRLPADIFERRSALHGIDLRGEAAMNYVERELAPFVSEFAAFPVEGPRPPGEFFLRNDNYESVDAELLYAMVRAGRPGRVVELGSGYTTLLINAAVRRNAADGAATEHVAYDPYPRSFIVGDGRLDGTRLEPVSALDVPEATFRAMDAGDILFVDTTHTVKLGSDVNHIVFEALPLLAPGVVVHFHDIFLPFEYPRAWFETMSYFWAEQYLLQAFLMYNDAFDVQLPAQLLARDYAQRLAAVIPSAASGASPGALWLRRR